VALISSLAILLRHRPILTPATGFLGIVFLVVQTTVFSLLPGVLKPDLLHTQEGGDAANLDLQRLSKLAGRVFALLTIYLAVSPSSSVLSQEIMASSILTFLRWVSVIYLVGSPPIPRPFFFPADASSLSLALYPLSHFHRSQLSLCARQSCLVQPPY
jgi:hypothetical protein